MIDDIELELAAMSHIEAARQGDVERMRAWGEELKKARAANLALEAQVEMLTGALQGLRLIFTHGGLYLQEQTREQLCRIVDTALAATSKEKEII